MMHIYFSPAPELALFFGMTSAETEEVQVGFSRWGQRCGSTSLFFGYQLLTLQVQMNCAPFTPLNGILLGLGAFSTDV